MDSAILTSEISAIVTLKDLDIVALPKALEGRGQPSKPCANDKDLDTGLLVGAYWSAIHLQFYSKRRGV